MSETNDILHLFDSPTPIPDVDEIKETSKMDSELIEVLLGSSEARGKPVEQLSLLEEFALMEEEEKKIKELANLMNDSENDEDEEMPNFDAGIVGKIRKCVYVGMMWGRENPNKFEGAGDEEYIADDSSFGSRIASKFSPKLAKPLNECKSITILAFPMAISYLLGILSSLINISFAGHLGKEKMGGASLAVLFFNVTAYSVALGVLTALDTLASQAYGAKNYHKVGVVLQRSLLVLTIIMIPTIGLWLLCEPLLIFLHQDPATARLAARYLKIMIVALPFSNISESFKRYLQAQGIVLPGTLAQLIALVTCIGSNILLVDVWDLGLDGNAVSLVLTNIANCVILVGISLIGKIHEKTWGGWSLEAFQSVGQYVLLGLGGMGMVCADWMGFELQTLLAGMTGTLELDSNAILFNTILLLYMVPLSLSISTCTKVGNAFGSGKPKSAWRTTKVAMCMVIIVTTTQGLILVAVRKYWGWLFSNSDEVVELTAKILPLTALFAIADGMMGICGAVFRAAGRQILGGFITFCCHFLLGLPLAALLSLHFKKGLIGQWIALGIAATLAMSVYFVLVFTMDYRKYAEEAMQRENESRLTEIPTDVLVNTVVSDWET